MSTKISAHVNSAFKKIVGKFCHSCNETKPEKEFSEKRGSRPARCDNCIRKWEKREPRKSR